MKYRSMISGALFAAVLAVGMSVEAAVDNGAQYEQPSAVVVLGSGAAGGTFDLAPMSIAYETNQASAFVPVRADAADANVAVPVSVSTIDTFSELCTQHRPGDSPSSDVLAVPLDAVSLAPFKPNRTRRQYWV